MARRLQVVDAWFEICLTMISQGVATTIHV